MGSKRKKSDSQEHEKTASKQKAAGKRRRESKSPERDFEILEMKRKKKNEKRQKYSELEIEAITIIPTATEVPRVVEVEFDKHGELIWDPEKTYIGERKAPKGRRKRPARRERYKAPEGKPILSRRNIPTEWKWNEWDLDLDRNDIEGQIQRCKERIEDGILPFIFKDRLSEFEVKKHAKDQIMAKHPGHTFEVAQCLENLLFIEESLQKKDSDEYKQLPNVRALIKAYKSKALDWNQGLVTYWSHGRQLCQPRPLSWKEFYAVNRMHDGWESFWVEGLNGPGPSKKFVKMKTELANANLSDFNRFVSISLRIPLCEGAEIPYDFIDDTGSDMACVFRNNVLSLAQAALAVPNSGYAGGVHTATRSSARVPLPPIVGVVTILCALGTQTVENVILLEANAKDDNDEYIMPHWSPIQVGVMPDRGPGDPELHRLSGPWCRSQLFMTTIPDNSNTTYYFDHKTAFGDIDMDHIKDPSFREHLQELPLASPPADPWNSLQLER
ncbi:hypothetical protein N7478_006939 [Penicillium angulare]|uniref:uncharacterized protein n=1 Tax=Penicillium angulare TaxID=116970 RepID=UPI0025425FF7|nr:uncharacterized protein N7478_006939 [Penicillium angulare]KAJ5281567.1 hypothetical protein N7478_006939 [Penicillium angulare]